MRAWIILVNVLHCVAYIHHDKSSVHHHSKFDCWVCWCELCVHVCLASLFMYRRDAVMGGKTLDLCSSRPSFWCWTGTGAGSWEISLASPRASLHSVQVLLRCLKFVCHCPYSARNCDLACFMMWLWSKAINRHLHWSDRCWTIGMPDSLHKVPIKAILLL